MAETPIYTWRTDTVKDLHVAMSTVEPVPTNALKGAGIRLHAGATQPTWVAGTLLYVQTLFEWVSREAELTNASISGQIIGDTESVYSAWIVVTSIHRTGKTPFTSIGYCRAYSAFTRKCIICIVADSRPARA